MFRTFALLVCLLPITVSAEEYVCNMVYQDGTKNSYLLSVKRSGEQFVIETNDFLGETGTFTSEQILEDENQIALTRLDDAGLVQVFLLDKDSLEITYDWIFMGNEPDFWVPRRGTCMVTD